jgi:excinuclease UvrABC nuclease subunit
MTKEQIAGLLEGVPSAVGVYYIYDKHDALIYVGKSIDIRNRLLQHFRSTDFKERKIQGAACRVGFELTGHELLALLYESDLIKKHQPYYNRAQRRTYYGFGLYLAVNDFFELPVGAGAIISYRGSLSAVSKNKQVTDVYETLFSVYVEDLQGGLYCAGASRRL